MRRVILPIIYQSESVTHSSSNVFPLKQRTILLYAHYDIQPASLSDGWKYEPMKLTVNPDGSGRMYGRGSSDDKGPLFGWINVLEAHVKQGLDMPVRIAVSMRSLMIYRLRDGID